MIYNIPLYVPVSLVREAISAGRIVVIDTHTKERIQLDVESLTEIACLELDKK